MNLCWHGGEPHEVESAPQTGCEGCGAPEDTLSVTDSLRRGWCCVICQHGGLCECAKGDDG